MGKVITALPHGLSLWQEKWSRLLVILLLFEIQVKKAREIFPAAPRLRAAGPGIPEPWKVLGLQSMFQKSSRTSRLPQASLRVGGEKRMK